MSGQLGRRDFLGVAAAGGAAASLALTASPSAKKLLEMLRLMRRIRHFEERLTGLYRYESYLKKSDLAGDMYDFASKGVIAGAVHLYIGEEAVAVGMCAALERDDYVTSTHRGHGHALPGGRLRSDDGRALRQDRLQPGHGGSMHIFPRSWDRSAPTGIVGGNIPVATGAGLACKFSGNGQVAVAFFGEGATNNGTFHEALNMAACGSCRWSSSARTTSTPPRPRPPSPWPRPTSPIAALATAFPARSSTVRTCWPSCAAVERPWRARAPARGPTLLECKTYRFTSHAGAGQGKHDNPEEPKKWLKRDPIALLEKKLRDDGLMTAAEQETLKQQTIAEVEEAVTFAKQSPFPAPATCPSTRIPTPWRNAFSSEHHHARVELYPGDQRSDPEEMKAATRRSSRSARTSARCGPRGAVEAAPEEPHLADAHLGVGLRGAVDRRGDHRAAADRGHHVLRFRERVHGPHREPGRQDPPHVGRADQSADGDSHPGGAGTREGGHHSGSLESWFVHAPGLKVVMPSDPYDAKGLMKSAIRDDGPVVYIQHRILHRLSKGQCPEGEWLVPLGKAAVKRAGSDITVVGISVGVMKALEAADSLAGKISVEVVDPRTLVPLDIDTILASVRKTGHLLVVHERAPAGRRGGRDRAAGGGARLRPAEEAAQGVGLRQHGHALQSTPGGCLPAAAGRHRQRDPPDARLTPGRAGRKAQTFEGLQLRFVRPPLWGRGGHDQRHGPEKRNFLGVSRHAATIADHSAFTVEDFRGGRRRRLRCRASCPHGRGPEKGPTAS